MNDQQNMRLIMSNFYRNIAQNVERISDEAMHDEHLSASEEGYVNTECPVCRRENPYWFAMLERKFGAAL